MRPLNTLLDRFRRGVAVPAAAGDDLAAELAPVFASLERFEEEAAELARSSARRAEERLAEGREQVARISATWREAAAAERTRAAEERRRRAHEEALALEEHGRAEGERIRRRATERIPGLVDAIVARVERGPP